MSEAKHTPGPWEVKRLYSNGCETCPRILAGGEWVADVVGAPHLGHESTIPNARLIAAAPDLLEACTGLLGDFSGDSAEGRKIDARSPLQKATDAIAKAEGRA